MLDELPDGQLRPAKLLARTSQGKVRARIVELHAKIAV
jgi:hypothetical protein